MHERETMEVNVTRWCVSLTLLFIIIINVKIIAHNLYTNRYCFYSKHIHELTFFTHCAIAPYEIRPSKLLYLT